MSQRAWTLFVKPPRDRPKASARAPFSRPLPRHGREPWCCRSCAASHRSGRDRPASASEHPDSLLCPAPEAHIDRVPLAVALAHVPPRATYPQHMMQTVEKAPVIASRSCPSSPLRWQQRTNQFPFRIRQVPTVHNCSPMNSLESERDPFGNPLCQHNLAMAQGALMRKQTTQNSLWGLVKRAQVPAPGRIAKP